MCRTLRHPIVAFYSTLLEDAQAPASARSTRNRQTKDVTRSAILVRSLAHADSEWAARTLQQTWGSVLVARKGELIDTTQHPGFVATIDSESVGLATSWSAVSSTKSSRCQHFQRGKALAEHCCRTASPMPET